MMNIDDPAAPWNRYPIDRASALDQTFVAVVLSRIGDRWVAYYRQRESAIEEVVENSPAKARAEGFISDSLVEELGDDFEVEAEISTEYTDGEHRWNEYGLRRSEHFRKHRKIGETFDHWLKAALKAGSLRKVDFLEYRLPPDDEGQDDAVYVIAKRRIVD